MVLFSLSKTSVGEVRGYSQARMVGGKENALSDGGARGPAEPEPAKTTLGSSPDHRVPANERRE
jgi:hypothetical protein